MEIVFRCFLKPAHLQLKSNMQQHWNAWASIRAHTQRSNPPKTYVDMRSRLRSSASELMSLASVGKVDEELWKCPSETEASQQIISESCQ